MLANIRPVEELGTLARMKNRKFETKSVHARLVEEYRVKGWSVDKENKNSVRVIKIKSRGSLLEDRVWMLLYRMGFTHLSDAGGAALSISRDSEGPTSMLDVVGIDQDIALAIECKSAENLSRRPAFQEELGKHALIRAPFSTAVRKTFEAEQKRQIVLAMFLSQVILSENDKARAKEANVVLFDEQDLSYYETLVEHLGTAAKYQFFADMLPGKEVPGLEICVPAIRFKMGDKHCYNFALTPDYLLKICYVSHRSKGKASDINAYQRMVSKSRLNKIKQHISAKGYFPTSIVVNLEMKYLQFDQVHQEGETEESGRLGWLKIRPAYKSAWIIDGQHRLFGYSGHERAKKAKLSVTAFAGLPPSQQARLFIEINSKQKKVPQILLQTLVAELNWDADSDEVRLEAIISKAIQQLDEDLESVFCGRIQTSEDSKDPKRCITITSVHAAIEKAAFHIAKRKSGLILEFGPLWAGDNDKTLKRTNFILNKWFELIRNAASDWWDKGSLPGGGLAMNDGVGAGIGVLKSVFQHLDRQGKKLIGRDSDDLFELVKKYGEAFAAYLGSLSEEERKKFRDLRGAQGVGTRVRHGERAIREQFAEFNPDGLDEFLEKEKAQTNSRAKEIIDRIEKTLHEAVISELKQEFGEDEADWWIEGVPKSVRLETGKRFEEDDGKRGEKEKYFDFIHYRKIIIENWDLFSEVFAFGKKGVGKDKGTQWMEELNQKRNCVAHSSSGISLSLSDLNQIQEYEEWLRQQIAGRGGASTQSNSQGQDNSPEE
jgi:DGQHR domain-containing protein